MTAGVYGLIDPRTNEIRYIGESKDIETRYANHLSGYRRSAPITSVGRFLVRWLRELNSGGLRPELKVLFDLPDSTKKDRLEMEERAIDMYRELLGQADLNLKGGWKNHIEMIRNLDAVAGVVVEKGEGQ